MNEHTINYMLLSRVYARKIIRCACLLLLILLTASVSFALDVPSLHGFVNDSAHVFTDTEKKDLSNLLTEFNEEGVVQIAVLTIDSLNGDNLESYSLRVAESWELGSAQKDNGVLLLVALNDHKMRIEVGYGLEGTLTDAQCGIIIRTIMAPAFKKSNYAAGIENAVKEIARTAGSALVSADEDLSTAADDTNQKKSFFLWLKEFFETESAFTIVVFIVIFLTMLFFVLFFLAAIILPILSTIYERLFPYNYTNPFDDLMEGMFGGCSGGSSSSYSSSSSRSSHSSGGHFGGGGASGSW